MIYAVTRSGSLLFNPYEIITPLNGVYVEVIGFFSQEKLGISNKKISKKDVGCGL